MNKVVAGNANIRLFSDSKAVLIAGKATGQSLLMPSDAQELLVQVKQQEVVA